MIAKLTRENIEKAMTSIGKKYKARKKKVKESNLLKEEGRKPEDEELYFTLYVDGVENASKALFEDISKIIHKLLPTIPKNVESLEIWEYEKFKGVVFTQYFFEKEIEQPKQESHQIQPFQPQAANLGNIPDNSNVRILEEQILQIKHNNAIERLEDKIISLEEKLANEKELKNDAYKEIDKLENQLNLQAAAALQLGEGAKLGNQVLEGVKQVFPMIAPTLMGIAMEHKGVQTALAGYLAGLPKEEEASDKDITDEQEGLLAWAEQISESLGSDNFQKITIICNVLAQNPEKIATVMSLLKD